MNERRVHLHHTLQSAAQAPLAVGHPLFALLDALARAGSIQHAARALGASYRHVWGQLRQWEQWLGEPLVVWTQGQPARLTAAGERLRLAHELLCSRLAPQLDALRSGLEQVLAVTGAARAMLQVAGVHEPALVALRELAAERVALDLVLHTGEGAGDLGALQALHEGRCDLALLRLPPGEAGQRLWQQLCAAAGLGVEAPAASAWARLPLASRTLGWMLRPGAQAQGRPDPGHALDELLRTVSTPRLVRWPALDAWARWQSTWWASHGRAAAPGPAVHHVLEAAGCVATAAADLAAGTAAAAQALGLDFVPMDCEDLLLVAPAALLEAARQDEHRDAATTVDALARLLGLLVDPAWPAALQSVPGALPAAPYVAQG